MPHRGPKSIFRQDGEILVREDTNSFSVIEAWPDEQGNPEFYVILQSGMSHEDALQFAARLRRSCEMK